MMENETARFDTQIRTLVHAQSEAALTQSMVLVSDVASPIALGLLALIGCGVFWSLGERREAAFLALSLAGCNILNIVLKMSFRRPRPIPFYGLAAPESFSFPSGHSLISFSFFCMLAYLLNRHVRSRALQIAIMACAVLLSVVVGYSRIYLGVHYPSDVLAGFIAGTVWCCVVMAAFSHLYPSKKT